MSEELKNAEELAQEQEHTKTDEESAKTEAEDQSQEEEKVTEQEEIRQEGSQAQGTADRQDSEQTQRRWRGGRLHFGEEEDMFFRDEEIISKLEGEDLLTYLSMEQKKEEMRQNAREVRERRIFSGFQLTVSLAAIVAIVGFLRDNPTVLVNILYIIGIIAALWILKHPKDK